MESKIIEYALNLLLANIDETTEEDLGMTHEEIEKSIEDIKNTTHIIYVSEEIALDFSKKNNYSPAITVDELVEAMKGNGYKVIKKFPGRGGKMTFKMEK